MEIYTQPNDGRERVVHRQLRNQDAYDTWHLSIYFQEILSYKRLQGVNALTFADLPRKEKNLLLYLMFACRPEFRTVLELGSSLFEMIDGLELVGRYLRERRSNIPSVDTKDLSYVGIELSELFSLASTVLHPSHRITLHGNAAEAEGSYDVLYDRSVTNYAFDSAEQLASLVNRTEVALLNTYFSKGETFISSRLGKSLTYFSLQETIQQLDKPLYHLFGEKAPGPFSGSELNRGNPVVEGFFLSCEPDFAADFMTIAGEDDDVKSYFTEKEIRLKEADTLLSN